MRLVDVGGVARVEVRTTGADSGEPLVLIQTALAPDEVARLGEETVLADRCRVVDVRRRGYGAGTPVEGPGSVVRDAEDCLAVLRALGIERAHVVGASYSAAVALELLALDAARVASLTVSEPPPGDGPHAVAFRAANEELARTFEEHGVTAALEEFTVVLGAPSWLAERASAAPELVAAVERDATTFFTADVPALLRWRPDAGRLGEHDVPCLYVGGAETHPWFRDRGDWVAGLLPGCRVEMVDGAGHAVVGTHTATVARLVADLIGSRSTRPR